MKIVQIAAEMGPYVKVGGLGDVTSALTPALAELGHKVHFFLPFYKALEKKGAKDLGVSVSVSIRGEIKKVGLWKLMHGDVNLILLREDGYFLRPGVYGERGEDYKDNLDRFVILCRASIEGMKALELSPDIVHSHDWHAALTPVYLRTISSKDFPKAATVLTIHNLGYQGLFDAAGWPTLGLPNELFTTAIMEFYGRINLLKGGMIFSDAITVVSPTYAKEILTQESGFGLDGVLSDKKSNVHGILNGIDVNEWNPRLDTLIPAKFDVKNLQGKARCKSELQETFGLDKDPKSPVAGMITRLVKQKGVDLLAEIIDEMVSLGIQIVILGTGENEYEEIVKKKVGIHAGRVGVKIAFDNKLAHLIEAGSDMFLMPSRYEPCGLNQMMSLMYGTVPVVRRTGGLSDTIHEFDPRTKKGNGFTFDEYSPGAFIASVKRAVEIYRTPSLWKLLMKNGMTEDHSWANAAQDYVSLYSKLLKKGK